MKTTKAALLLLSLAACAPSGSDSTADPAAAPRDAPGADDPPVASACPTPDPSRAPTKHEGRIGDETWTADASPHVIDVDVTVVGTLTIEPCAEVLIGAGKTVGVSGRIVAQGTASQRIHIGAKDAAPFASIHATTGTLAFAYATIDGGGDPLNTLPYLAGAIDVQGADASKPTQEVLSVDHVTIEGSKSNGIVVRDGAGFAAGSTNLVVHGAAQHPVNIWSRAAGTLPAGTYTGNAIDEILLPATDGYEAVHESTTFHDRGVPYRVGDAGSKGDLQVVPPATGGPLATLTIEPGVTLRFVKGGVMHVETAQTTAPARGALVAVGTADKPITFTSAAGSPAAGDWLGVWFGGAPDPSSRMDHAVVEFAGGSSATGSDSCTLPGIATNDAAIRVLGVPSSELVTNTLVRASASHGIDRG
ncbi:MAG TPA: hypothetical protein VIF62_13890, partial [Labilithrix sp.]